MNEKETVNTEIPLNLEPKKPVNESSGLYFSSSIKIYDPNTTEVLVQMRGDN
jgi:hypothetical protein